MTLREPARRLWKLLRSGMRCRRPEDTPDEPQGIYAMEPDLALANPDGVTVHDAGSACEGISCACDDGNKYEDHNN